MTRFTIDSALILRSPSDAAETATAAETGVALDVLNAGTFHVVVDVIGIDTTTGNETYAVAVETDSLAAFSDSPVQVAAVTVTSTGRYILTLDQDLVGKMDPNAAAIRVKATLGGTTPIISYGAFLAPAA